MKFCRGVRGNPSCRMGIPPSLSRRPSWSVGGGADARVDRRPTRCLMVARPLLNAAGYLEKLVFLRQLLAAGVWVLWSGGKLNQGGRF